MTRIIALILALAFASPAVAADPSCPPEASMDGLKTAIQDAHGVVLGGAAYDTADGQTVIVIYAANGSAFMAAFKDGCVAAQPLLLEHVELVDGKPAKDNPGV